MEKVEIGQKIPNFEFETTKGKENFDQYREQNLILYFYPKDSTPGCTMESKEFRDYFNEFQKHKTAILGISRDKIPSHTKFIQNQSLPFDLISDSDESLCKFFDVMKMKSMFGKSYLGLERSTFLIDKTGVLRQEWRKVKVKGHVKEVLEAVKNL